MAIPNTTPTPNELFDTEMRKMSDSEFRVTSIVVRATFGWIIDKKTGMRKEEDWISLSQMVKKSGKSPRAIKYAVQGCIEKGWIEVRSKDGEILDTGEKRQQYGQRLFYRVGPVLLGETGTSAEFAQVEPVQPLHRTSATVAQGPVQPLHPTKETLTKETLTKGLHTKRTLPNGEIRNNRLAGKPYSKSKWLLSLSDNDVTYIQEEFPDISADAIRQIGKDCYYWQKTKGTWKKDQKMTLRNWVKNDTKWKNEKKGRISFHEYK